MVKRSTGLGVHLRVAKAAGKDGRNLMPRYLDGTIYRCGDEVLEGQVMYYRPTHGDEDNAVDMWRLVVSPRGGGPAVSVEPSKTRAVRNDSPLYNKETT